MAFDRGEIARALVAALLAAAVALVYAVATGLSFNAHARGWEMGAIPFLLAAFAFVGLLAGLIAGLVAGARPYLAAMTATVCLALVSTILPDWKDSIVPGLTTDQRREFWANIDGLVFAGFPFGVPFALWGSLIVDRTLGADARAQRWIRDGSYGLAGFLSVVALMPLALHWLAPWAALATAILLPAAFFTWASRRNAARGASMESTAPR